MRRARAVCDAVAGTEGVPNAPAALGEALEARDRGPNQSPGLHRAVVTLDGPITS